MQHQRNARRSLFATVPVRDGPLKRAMFVIATFVTVSISLWSGCFGINRSFSMAKAPEREPAGLMEAYREERSLTAIQTMARTGRWISRIEGRRGEVWPRSEHEPPRDHQAAP